MSNSSNASNSSSFSGCDDDASQSAFAQLTTITCNQETTNPIQKDGLNAEDRGSYPTPPSDYDDASNNAAFRFFHMNNVNNYNG